MPHAPFLKHVVSGSLFHLKMSAGAPSAHATDALREVFDLYATSSLLPTSSLAIAVRSLGHSPTEAELGAICSSAGEGVPFDEFAAIVAGLKDTKLEVGDVLEAFKVLDRDGDGRIGKDELKKVLMTRGEKMSEEEASGLVGLVEADENGLIDYRLLSDALMN